MSFSTTIGQNLEILIEQELLRMENEWFFKWHFIGENWTVEIDGFDGRKIKYSGIAYSGSAIQVYWCTISRYCRIKVPYFFNSVEDQLLKYPIQIRKKAIHEAKGLIETFTRTIRQKAVEKDLILRRKLSPNATKLDRGYWDGSDSHTIEGRANALVESYCIQQNITEGRNMPFSDMMNDKLIFVKKDGSYKKRDVLGLITEGKAITFDVSLQIQPGDLFLRELPSGLVEEYIIIDPGFNAGMGRHIPASYQAVVKRSDATKETANTIINNIQGANARVNINSTDNSQNMSSDGVDAKIFEELRTLLTNSSISQEENLVLKNQINEMERVQGTPDFKDKYRDFMASASNHASVFGALFGALAMFV